MSAARSVGRALWEAWGPRWTFLAGAGFAAATVVALAPLGRRLAPGARTPRGPQGPE